MLLAGCGARDEAPSLEETAVSRVKELTIGGKDWVNPVPDTEATVADLASKRVQDYRDGQLKWIIENGIRFTGMPAWKGLMDDTTMWRIVRYIRHLPPKGSLGPPPVYSEAPGHTHSNGAPKAPGHSHR
jgi:hypothetical protein